MPAKLSGRLAIFADIHGNALALEAMLDALRKEHIDAFISLGDAVGYFPDVNNVLNTLEEYNFFCLKGNHEAMLLKELTIKDDTVYKLCEQRSIIPKLMLGKISIWPHQCSIKTILGEALLMHGSTLDPLNGCIYPDTPLEEIYPKNYSFLITAHTHRPYARLTPYGTALNVGSVGLPRDNSGFSSGLILDTEKGNYTFIKTPLDKRKIFEIYKTQVHQTVLERI